MAKKEYYDNLSLEDLVNTVKENAINEQSEIAKKPLKPHVILNLSGFPMNKKYPPDHKRYGSAYDGYKTWNQEAFFYDFAVMCYDLSFCYNGNQYYLVTCEDHAAVCDENFTKEYDVFPNENELIEHFRIDGKPIIELIDELENVEVY